jgi:hypothetical protein
MPKLQLDLNYMIMQIVCLLFCSCILIAVCCCLHTAHTSALPLYIYFIMSFLFYFFFFHSFSSNMILNIYEKYKNCRLFSLDNNWLLPLFYYLIFFLSLLLWTRTFYNIAWLFNMNFFIFFFCSILLSL